MIFEVYYRSKDSYDLNKQLRGIYNNNNENRYSKPKNGYYWYRYYVTIRMPWLKILKWFKII